MFADFVQFTFVSPTDLVTNEQIIAINRLNVCRLKLNFFTIGNLWLLSVFSREDREIGYNFTHKDEALRIYNLILKGN